MSEDGRLEFTHRHSPMASVTRSRRPRSGTGQVHVVTPDVGGGFGAKARSTRRHRRGWCAQKLGRRCAGPRRVRRAARIGSRPAQVQHVRMAGRARCLLAYRIEVLQDTGAYAGLVRASVHDAHDDLGPYKFPAECASYSVVTNSTPTTAYAGGRRATRIERSWTVRARNRHGPADCARNLIEKDDFPTRHPWTRSTTS